MGRIHLDVKLEFSKGSTSFSCGVGDRVIDVSDAQFFHHRQSVGSGASSALETGEVTLGGYLVAVNQDATNYVEIFEQGGAKFIRLNAGECAVFRTTADATLNAQGDTAAVELEFIILGA
jgi:ketopantoate hydroxymethyltransferase